MKAIQFNEDFPALPMEDFQNHYTLVFDLNSLEDAAKQLHYPEISGESLRLEMFFQFPLEQVTESIVLGERLSNVQVDEFGTVAKMFSFLGFQVPIQKLLTFVGLSMIMVSVLSILFFFKPKSPEKADKECCLIENSINFFNLDCKPVFNNICPVHKFCV